MGYLCQVCHAASLVRFSVHANVVGLTLPTILGSTFLPQPYQVCPLDEQLGIVARMLDIEMCQVSEVHKRHVHLLQWFLGYIAKCGTTRNRTFMLLADHNL
jgi:hypothetical protein